jgi:hypothetical protein
MGIHLHNIILQQRQLVFAGNETVRRAIKDRYSIKIARCFLPHSILQFIKITSGH